MKMFLSIGHDLLMTIGRAIRANAKSRELEIALPLLHLSVGKQENVPVSPRKLVLPERQVGEEPRDTTVVPP